MSTTKATPTNDELTPVDDVRRVRIRLSEETGNDIHRLAEHARKVTEALWEKLGLIRAKDRTRDNGDSSFPSLPGRG